MKSDVEKLKSELKGKEEMCNKLKTVAVKTKKDLADLKSKVYIESFGLNIMFVKLNTPLLKKKRKRKLQHIADKAEACA